MDKLDRFICKHADEYTESERSRYYRFGDWIIRVSDHIALSSNFTISIITPTIHSCNMYVIHTKDAKARAIDYEDLKNLVKSFRVLAGTKMTPSKLKREMKAQQDVIKKYQKKIRNQKQTIKDLTNKMEYILKKAKHA